MPDDADDYLPGTGDGDKSPLVVAGDKTNGKHRELQLRKPHEIELDKKNGERKEEENSEEEPYPTSRV